MSRDKTTTPTDRAPWPKDASIVVDISGTVPAPKGNMRGFVHNGRAVLTDSKSAELKRFASSMREAASMQMAFAGLRCAVEQPFALTMAFYLPRPNGDFGKGKNAGKLTPSARVTPWVKPDLDKLQRAALDALTGIVYDDDSRVVRLVVEKKFAGARHDVGLWLEAKVLPPTLSIADLWAQIGLT